MQSSWHMETDVFAIILLLILLVKTLWIKKDRSIQGRGFALALIVSLLSTVIDVAATIVMTYGANWWVFQTLEVLYTLTFPVLGFVWVNYSVVLAYPDSPKHTRRLMAIFSVPFIVFAIVTCSNPWTGWAFGLSPELVYTRGPYFFAICAIPATIYTLGGLALVFVWRKRIRPRYYVVLLSSFYIVTAGALILQLFLPGTLLVNLTCAIAFVLCDTTIEENKTRALYRQISTQNDELTQALHRAETATAEAEKAAGEAREASRAKGEFLSRMSHEIRTPMNAIMGMATIARDNRADYATVSDCLDKIDVSAKYLLTLINDILEMSRIESGKIEISHERFSFDELLRSVATIVEPLAKRSGLRYDVTVDDACHGAYFGDAVRIQQVLVNLISNAVKFTKEGGRVRFSARSVQTDGDEARVRFSVEDTGVGIAPEFLPKLFETFSQEDGSTKSVYGGSGLGLPISKSIVEAMGGTIAVESLKNVGSTFTVEIPLKRAPTVAAGTANAQPSAASVSLRGCHVLLAEDHPLNIAVASRLLERKGAKVTVAENGALAVETFRAAPPHTFNLVLMDIRMPVMDGLEATREIRALDRADAHEIPIVAMTANALDEDRRRTREAGMNAHLSKPIDPDVFYQTLQGFYRPAHESER